MDNYASKKLKKATSQINYAGLDAVLHFELYSELVSLRRFVYGDLHKEDTVLLMDSAKQKRVVTGRVHALPSVEDVKFVDIAVTEVHMPGFKLEHMNRKTVEQVVTNDQTRTIRVYSARFILC